MPARYTWTRVVSACAWWNFVLPLVPDVPVRHAANAAAAIGPSATTWVDQVAPHPPPPAPSLMATVRLLWTNQYAFCDVLEPCKSSNGCIMVIKNTTAKG